MPSMSLALNSFDTSELRFTVRAENPVESSLSVDAMSLPSVNKEYDGRYNPKEIASTMTPMVAISSAVSLSLYAIPGSMENNQET